MGIDITLIGCGMIVVACIIAVAALVFYVLRRMVGLLYTAYTERDYTSVTEYAAMILIIIGCMCIIGGMVL